MSGLADVCRFKWCIQECVLPCIIPLQRRGLRLSIQTAAITVQSHHNWSKYSSKLRSSSLYKRWVSMSICKYLQWVVKVSVNTVNVYYVNTQDTCLLDLSRHRSTSNLMPVISWLKKSYLQVHGNVSIAWEASVFTTVQATANMLLLIIKICPSDWKWLPDTFEYEENKFC